MKKLVIFIITLVVGFLIYGAVMRVVGWDRIPEAFMFFLSTKGLVIIGLTAVIAVVSVLRWKFVLQKLTNRTDLKEVGRMWLAGYTITYLFTPIATFGGEPFRAYFAKKNCDISWKHSAASVIIDKILDWTIMIPLTIIGLFIFLSYGVFPLGTITLIAGLIMAALLVFLVVFYAKALKKESVLEFFLKLFNVKRERLEKSQNGKLILDTEDILIKFLSPKNKAFWQALSLAFLRYLLFYIRVAFLILFLEKGIHIMQTLGVYGVTNIALFFPVPAALGSLEVLGWFSFKTLGFSVAAGTVFAMVLRGADILTSLVGLIFLIKYTFKFAGRKVLNFFDKIRE